MKLNIGNYLKLDWAIVIPVVFLSFFGLSAIYSIALGQGRGEFLNFQKQFVWLLIGFLAMIFFANIDYKVLRKFSWLAYAIGIILLILVLTPLGVTVRGSRGWFDFGFASFQPVEIMKLFLIIFLADVCARYARTTHKFSQLIFIGLIVLIPFAFVLLQPDFGSAMVLFFIWFFSFAFLTKNKKHIILIIALIIASFALSWMFLLKDYQKDRILTFADPSRDPAGAGYNVRQSIIAVGAGGVLGKGLGFGSQSQLKFIPESQTDFIFSVIAEELGLIGSAFIIIFYGIIFWRLFTLAAKAPDDYAMFISIMSISLLFVHVFINIGMCIGLLPVTGISLPFVSYGGSLIVPLMILLGVNNNIYRSSIVSRKF